MCKLLASVFPMFMGMLVFDILIVIVIIIIVFIGLGIVIIIVFIARTLAFSSPWCSWACSSLAASPSTSRMGRMTLASTQFHRFDDDDGDNVDDDDSGADDADCDHGHEFITRACGGLSRH